MRAVLRKGTYTITLDTEFEGVIQGCAHRPDEGTWITDDFIQAYIELHKLGFAHSVKLGPLLAILSEVCMAFLWAACSLASPCSRVHPMRVKPHSSH